MAWGSARTVSHRKMLFKGVVPCLQTTLTVGTDEEKPVKIATAKTATLCSNEDVFHGFIVSIGKGVCGVQLQGFIEADYSGYANPQIGREYLCADGAGKVKAGDHVATGTITVSGGLPTAAETFVVGTQTFAFQAGARTAAGQVQIGGDADACVTNIAAAINADLTTVVAVPNLTADTVVIYAKTPGTAGNSIPLTESATNVAVDGSGTLGGTVAGADGSHGREFLVTDVDTVNKKVTFLLKQ